MNVPLGKGIFLVASPGLRDPNFRQTVVLLCEHGDDGALGVVVNRPTAMMLSEAVPQIPVLEGQCHKLFAGGPVQPNQVMILFRLSQEGTEQHHIFDGVYLGGDLGILERVLTRPSGAETFRAYIGYSGWGAGQLENEMQSGAWITLPADPFVVFEKDPQQIWPDIMRSLGNRYEFYADMPPDPQLN